MDADTDEERIWFWKQSANGSESDLLCNGYFNEEGDLRFKRSKTKEEAPLQKHSKEIK